VPQAKIGGGFGKEPAVVRAFGGLGRTQSGSHDEMLTPKAIFPVQLAADGSGAASASGPASGALSLI